MAAANRRRIPATSNVSELHRRWLELVDIEGPFLAIPPLKRVWPNGIPNFRSTHPDRFEVLNHALKDFEAAWESLDRAEDSSSTLDAYRVARDKWVETVLRDVVGWAESLEWGAIPGVEAQSPNRAVTVTAQGAIVGADGTRALVHVTDATESLRQTPNDLWAATPIDRLDALLRENDVEIGIVTDGRWWGLVYAGEGRMTASGVVDALTWVEEPRTRDAFFTLAGRQHIIGGDPTERLPVLFAESVAAAEEITEALGSQVRRAVELLIQSFSESASEARRLGKPDPLPDRTHDTYEAAVTVMMRVVFLLFAEERGLLPSGELFEQGYGISRELDRLDAESTPGEEVLEATSLTWHRLLATSGALYKGASLENLRMPAYGGSLFDPDRFAFLTAITDEGTLAVVVSDRVMLHVLRSVQVATVRGEARRISFRDIDVEQIGYIYEGLLGYTCKSVDETYLGILGTMGEEPEIPLGTIEQLARENTTPEKLAGAIRKWVKENQPSAKPATAAKIAKALQADADPSVVSALAQTVADNSELLNRIAPWLGLIRRDLRGHPFVLRGGGGLLVAETPSRRNAGAHYTPKSLAEEVVFHTLEPLCYSPGPHQTSDEASWQLRSSDELLNLKVADIACGSGAFLVAATRYLADRVVEAWISEEPANAQRMDLHTRAKRQVVANCLYGADINDMAVEMCKLSLWLVSLDRDLPFSFVDDKIFLGNSLLGLTSLDQLRKLHIDPTRVPMDRRFDIFDVDVDEIIHKAVSLREHLLGEIDDNDPARSSATKRRQHNESKSVTSPLRQIADGIIAAGLPLGGKPGRELDAAYVSLRCAVRNAYPDDDTHKDARELEALIVRGLTPAVKTDFKRWQPLHWPIEAPDVIVDRSGFDAIIGNPPFLGGQKLSGAMGSEIRDWFVHVLANGKRGSADLVAYFFLRILGLLADNGTIGLIATNTIAQGVTRQVGLDQIVDQGLTIMRSIQSRPWPATSASLEFAAVWGTQSSVLSSGLRVSDGVPVAKISTFLEPAGRIEQGPEKLVQNKNVVFQGCIVLGSGFIVDPEEAMGWIQNDPSNKEVLFPYLSGDDLNSRPNCSASRWVIDFAERTEEAARKYEGPFNRVAETVLPERKGKNDSGARKYWWRFLRPRPALRSAIDGLNEVIVIAGVSKTVMPGRVNTGTVFPHHLVVFASESYSLQACLSSSIHQMWAIMYGSTMGSGPRYTPERCFKPFPLPPESEALASMGRILHGERREIMLRRQLGLTGLYNLVNSPEIGAEADPDVARMRQIHIELDEVVMDAYGWPDVALDHGHHTYRQMERWTVSPTARVEILDRLLEENHRRASKESPKPRAMSHHSKKGRNVTEELFS